MEAIILAGGLGTRLQPVVKDLPKAMAPVADNPFLYYLLESLNEAGFRHIILAVGYKHEVIENWLANYHTPMRISIVVEEEPLGTGGATKLSLSQAEGQDVFVLNGDTFFSVDYSFMLSYHHEMDTEATLALKEMRPVTRYGLVELHKDSRIAQFREKQYCDSGLINGGVYLLRKNALTDYPDKFSLEKDYFEKIVKSRQLAGFPSDRYFIDIGVPEDYEQVQKDFADGKYKTF